ncbi:MAG TPA: AAA family ATPase, partial [Chloroflexota bacterium]
MYTTQLPAFGLLLKRHRRAAGLTQEELAERAGVSARAVGDLERGLRQPRRDTLVLLLDALQLAPEEASRLETAARAGSLPSPVPGQTRSLLQTGSFLGAAPPGPLISRRDEVHRIVPAIDAAVSGSSRLILLTGEAGIGKTRLVQEIALEAERRGFLVASGRCYEPEQEVPFYPFLELLATVFSAVPRAVREQIPRRWSHLVQLLPEDAFGSPVPERPGWVGGLDDQQRLLRAVVGFLGAIAEEVPVALLLDDLHWADEASLKLLLHLARHTRGDRILMIGTYRDVEVHPQHALARALVDLNRERLVERVVVNRLDQQSTTELIVATIGDIDVSPEFAALIHSRTDGNPFLIQEVLRSLVERGDLFQENGWWTYRDVREFGAPETVRAMIQQRLSLLRPQIQMSLYEASVLGQSFSFDDLLALGQHSEKDLDDAIEAGVAAGLIREGGVEGYTFNHALTQQALYGDLSLRRRQRLHLAAGEALHQLPEPRRNRRAAELAWHFREGGDGERATTYSMLAGEQALRVFAYGEAEHHFRMAAELAASGSVSPTSESFRARAVASLGHVLSVTERYDDALSALEEAAELYRRHGDAAAEAFTVTEIGWIHHNRGTDENGRTRVQPVVDQLERVATSSVERLALAALHTALARLFFGLGRHTEELAAAERAVELARAEGDDTVLGVAEARRGAALMTVGRREQARESLETAVALAEAAGIYGTVSVALENLGEIARDGGDYRQAQHDYERALELAEQTGVPGRIAWTLTKLGRIRLLEGEWAQARANFERALELLVDDPQASAYPRLHLGQLDLLEGNRERGSAQVEAAMNPDAQQPDFWLLCHGQRLLAERDLLDGNPAAALARLEPLINQPGATEPYVTMLFAPLAWAHLGLNQEREA